MKWLCKIFDFLWGPAVFQFGWHFLNRTSRLTEAETGVIAGVLGPDEPGYQRVRISEGRVLGFIFNRNGGRAFTTFRTINLPEVGRHSRSNVKLLVHEMVHVRQFEVVGSIYIWQALRAQRAEGYDYGGWGQLAEDRHRGRRFKDYNREQQGQIAEDYYADVVEPGLPADDPVRRAFEPLIEELRAREL
jgi:hypothetical protein